MEGSIDYRIEGNTAWVTFSHPQGNSLPGALLNALCNTLLKADQDKSIHVIVIASAGQGAFCGGASLSELKQLKTIKDGELFFMGFANLINTIRELSKFVIARVHGKVVGGGVGLAAACDYVIAHQKAAIRLSELSIGIGPYVIEPAVSRKIGTTAFGILSLEARHWKSAAWALEKGLYAKCEADTDALDLAVNTMAKELASYNPLATKTLRRLHWKNTEHWNTLLSQNAKITGQLALEKPTQDRLKSL